MKRSLLTLPLLLTVASNAAADPFTTYADQKAADGFRVVFTDDPLAAGKNDAQGGRIPVRGGAARMQLLKPRTQFVDAMLKSVESL